MSKWSSDLQPARRSYVAGRVVFTWRTGELTVLTCCDKLLDMCPETFCCRHHPLLHQSYTTKQQTIQKRLQINSSLPYKHEIMRTVRFSFCHSKFLSVYLVAVVLLRYHLLDVYEILGRSSASYY